MSSGQRSRPRPALPPEVPATKKMRNAHDDLPEAPPWPMTDEVLDILYPFVFRQVLKPDPVVKFGRSMDRDVLRTFAIYGPLLEIRRAFRSFESVTTENRYCGIFQQIFPSFSFLANPRKKVHLVSAAESSSAVEEDSENEEDSETTVYLYEFVPEASAEQGKPDYIVRSITKGQLEELKSLRKYINWEELSPEEFSAVIFKIVQPHLLRCDAVLDLKTTSVSSWDTKTRPQLVSYGHMMAQENLEKGFPPRPIYLLGIDQNDWRMCVFDACGIISVKAGEIDSSLLREHEKLRREWLQRRGSSHLIKFGDYKLEALKETLKIAQTQLRNRAEPTSSIRERKYVVANLWEEVQSLRRWNGRGLEDSDVFPGSLDLFEGLLRLLVGGKRIRRQNWTMEGVRELLRSKHEEDLQMCDQLHGWTVADRCKEDGDLVSEFTSRLLQHVKSSHPPRDGMLAGMLAAISAARNSLHDMTRTVLTVGELLQVGKAYGGRFFQYLEKDLHSAMLPLDVRKIWKVTVQEDPAQVNMAKLFRARKLFLMKVAQTVAIRNPTVILWDNASVDHIGTSLLQSVHKSGTPVVILGSAIGKVSRAIGGLIGGLQLEAFDFEMDRQSLDAVGSFLGSKVLDSAVRTLVPGDYLRQVSRVFGESGELVLCTEEPVQPDDFFVVELQVSRLELARTKQLALAASYAMNSALARGVVPGSRWGLFKSVKKLELEKDPHWNDPEWMEGVELFRREINLICMHSNVTDWRAAYVRDPYAANPFECESGDRQVYDMFLKHGTFTLWEVADLVLSSASEMLELWRKPSPDAAMGIPASAVKLDAS